MTDSQAQVYADLWRCTDRLIRQQLGLVPVTLTVDVVDGVLIFNDTRTPMETEVFGPPARF